MRKGAEALPAEMLATAKSQKVAILTVKDDVFEKLTIIDENIELVKNILMENLASEDN